MLKLDPSSIAILGRKKNAIVLDYNQSILITSDITKTRDGVEVPSITLDSVESNLELLAKDIVLSAIDSPNQDYSLVYGERLIELLKWIIKILKTHQHPPNNVPINTFFYEADNWIERMDSYLLNKHVRSK